MPESYREQLNRTRGRGGKEFSRPQSRYSEFLDIKHASLDEIIATEYFVPRRVDVRRIAAIPEALLSIQKTPNKRVSIVDLGGGKGTLDKLIAQDFRARKKDALIIDIDASREVIDKALRHYAGTPGLVFREQDISEITHNTFNPNPQLVIVSWVEENNSQIYKKAIEQIEPAAIMHILNTDPQNTDTLGHMPRYSPVAWWYGPTTENIGYNSYRHTEDRPYEEAVQNGDNMYQILLRDDLRPETSRLQSALFYADDRINEQYAWEEELRKLDPPFKYPEIDFLDTKNTHK